MKKWIIILGLGAMALAAREAGAQAPAVAVAAAAATIHLKDGTVVKPTKIRRSGSNLMATVTVGTGSGEVGYPVANIAKIDFPEVPQLVAAAALLSKDQGQEALSTIEPVLTFFLPYADIPGNHWAEAALLKLNALNSLGRDREAEALTAQLAKMSNDPELLMMVQVRQVKALLAKGEPEKAIEICDSVIEKSNSPGTLAFAWLNKGLSLAAKENWEPSALAFLHVPVFYPTQKLLIPQALLGAARAIVALDDKPEAGKHYQELIDTYPASAEAATAKEELAKLKL